MIVGLCGTHGTGKSTLLNSIKDAGGVVSSVQLSRQVQQKLGWEKLSYVTESIDNLWTFQDAVLEAAYDRDVHLEKMNDIVIVDRTPADIWAYTALWCTRLGLDVSGLPGASERAKTYKNMCRDMATRYALYIMIPSMKAISFKEEPNRADIESRAFVENEIANFLTSGNLPTHILKSASIQERTAETLSQTTLIRLGVKKRK